MDCAFHFATEEFVMSQMKPDLPVLMLWRTDMTVMLGANQVAATEADLHYAKARGIKVVRRSSGGGTIYTDPGVLLYTIILPFTEEMDTKGVIADYLAGPVIEALRRMGVAASLEGRNDILVDGKKISGIAQYILHAYICSHGSLLFDADLAELARVLTADDEKISSKALRSVRSRVTNISEHLPASGTKKAKGAPKPTDTLTFMKNLKESWHGEFGLTEYEFTEQDLAAIRKIRDEKYASETWTLGHTPRYTYRNSKRFPGGGVKVFVGVKRGAIESVRITGDFLSLRPVAVIEEKLTGVPFNAAAIADSLSDSDVVDALGSITKDELLSVFP
jgi:lipoate-protein ligase A